MSFTHTELSSLIQRHFEGQLTDEEINALNMQLRTELAACDLYLQLADLHSCLSVDEQLWVATPAAVEVPVSTGRRRFGRGTRSLALALLGLVVLVAVGASFLWTAPALPGLRDPAPFVATVRELQDGRSVSATDPIQKGDRVRVGRRMELSAGSATFVFTSGATVKLIGPAILEPLSANSAFLLLGQVMVTAETPESKGFTLTTRTSKFVDIGTAFVATAAANGQSRVDVSVGAVDVLLEGVKSTQHLKAGDALCVEPGERQVMTRIEEGDGTNAFRFPTIEPPSRHDYADQSSGHATIRLLRGKLQSGRAPSGPVNVLLDGTGQTHEDAPEQSAFIFDRTNGSFLLDLGSLVSVSKINSYSWHQNTTHDAHRQRAVQKFTLYGFAGDQPPPTHGLPSDAGWVRVTQVNSDEFFQVAQPLDRPAQQACSVTSARGDIGRFRYLLWDVEGTYGPIGDVSNNTFYGEFDVYAAP